MKILTKFFFVVTALSFLASCAMSEKEWHESSSGMLGYKATSIYIKSDGSASVAGFINDKYIIKNFDSSGDYIKGSRREISEKKMRNPNNFKGHKFTADMRDGVRSDVDKLVVKFDDEVNCKD